MLHMVSIASVAVVAVITQSPGGTVLPIYRDLLKDRPISEADYFDRCGSGAGPLELLKPTDLATRARLVHEVDAAKVPAVAERALARAAAALPGATVNVCLFMGELSAALLERRRRCRPGPWANQIDPASAAEGAAQGAVYRGSRVSP
jgi:hypothetical protein